MPLTIIFPPLWRLTFYLDAKSKQKHQVETKLAIGSDMLSQQRQSIRFFGAIA